MRKSNEKVETDCGNSATRRTRKYWRAGHRDGFFRGLKDIALADTIELKTPKGIDLYAVEEVSMASPNDVTALQPRPVP